MRRIVRWNPGRDLMTLREAMDRLVEDSFVRPTWQSEHVNRLPIDVYSTSDELVITASVLKRLIFQSKAKPFISRLNIKNLWKMWIISFRNGPPAPLNAG